jgi:hypothetical protein
MLKGFEAQLGLLNSGSCHHIASNSNTGPKTAVFWFRFIILIYLLVQPSFTFSV